MRMLILLLLGLLLGSGFSQRTSFQDVTSGNGLQMNREGGNSPLQNFQNLLPENMIPTGNEQTPQEAGPMGNLQFATSNINTVIRNNLSPDMAPFIPEINNIPVEIRNTISNQPPPNFPPMENIPNTLGTDFPAVELQRPAPQLPRLLPGPQPFPQRQIHDFIPRIGNEMDKQFQNIPENPIFFNSPFSPASLSEEEFGQSSFEQRFTEPLPYFLAQNRFEKNPLTFIEDAIFNRKQQVPYESLSERRYTTKPPPTSHTTTPATTSTTEEMTTTTTMTTTTDMPTTTTEMRTTTASYPYYYRNGEQRKSKNVYPMPRLRFPNIRSHDYNRKNTKKVDLFPMPRNQGRKLYQRRPLFKPNPRFLGRKFGGKRRSHKNCKNKRERRIQDGSSSESYGD